MAGDRVVIELTLDASGAVTGGRRVEGALDRVGNSGKRAESGLSAVGNAIKGFIVAQAAASLLTYTKRLFDLGTAAQETASKFQTVFGPAAAGLDARLQEFANTMGLTQAQARETAATLGAMAQGFGLTQGASAGFSEEVLRLAGDLSSFNNIPVAEALAAIQSGLTGEQEPLRRFGILMNDAAVKTRALTMTGKTSEAQLTEQDKALARLALISEKAGVAIGDLERTQDSEANTARRMTAAAGDQEQAFAQKLLPTFRLVMRTLDDLMQANTSTGESFSTALARGIGAAVVRGIQFFQAAGRLVSAIFGIGRSASAVAGGSGSPMALFEAQFASTLNLIDGFTEALLVADNATARFARGMFALRRDVALFNRSFFAEGSAGYNDQNTVAAAAAERIEALDRRIGEVGDALDRVRRAMSNRSRGVSAGENAFFDRIRSTNLGTPEEPEVPEMGLAPEIEAATRATTEAIENGAARMAAATEKAATDAEAARRAVSDRLFEARAADIELMREGTDRAVAQVHFDTDREVEAFRRRYDIITAEETARFEALRTLRLRQARAAEINPLSTISAAEAAARREERLREFREAERYMTPLDTTVRRVAAAYETLDLVGARTGRTLSGVARSLVGRYGESLGAMEGLLSAASGGLSDLYRRNVEEETAALEASGMAREDARAQAEENNEALRVNQKRLASAGVVFNTASAIMRAFAELGPIAGPIAAAGIAITGAAQLAAINAEQPPRASGGRGGSSPTRGAGVGTSSVGAGLAVGSGVASQGGTVVNVPRPAPPVVIVENRVTAGEFATLVRTGQAQNARGRGNSGSLQ